MLRQSVRLSLTSSTVVFHATRSAPRVRVTVIGVESLKAHAAYIDGLGWENWDPQEFLEGFARPVGQRLDVAFAAPFEVFPMGWGD